MRFHAVRAQAGGTRRVLGAIAGAKGVPVLGHAVVQESAERPPALSPCQVRVCGAADGCPRAVADVGGAAAAVRDLLERIDVAGVVRHKAASAPRILEHHRFKVTLSGCPNGCSQPQIADVGLIGEERPRLDECACIGCGLCVEACAESAFSLTGGRLRMDESLCVGCGACIRVCPVSALTAGEAGWRVLVGGRLGRHPRLGAEVASGADLDEALAVVTQVVHLWAGVGLPDERVGIMLDRLAGCEDQDDGEDTRRAALADLLLQKEVAS